MSETTHPTRRLRLLAAVLLLALQCSSFAHEIGHFGVADTGTCAVCSVHSEDDLAADHREVAGFLYRAHGYTPDTTCTSPPGQPLRRSSPRAPPIAH